MLRFILIIGILSTVLSQELVLVTRSDSKLDKIHSGELKRLYLGKSNIVQSNVYKPINLSQKSALSQKFLQEYLGMTEQKYIKWWVKQQIIGRSRPPIVLNDAQEVINLILLDNTYVGYIDSSQLTEKMKVVALKD